MFFSYKHRYEEQKAKNRELRARIEKLEATVKKLRDNEEKTEETKAYCLEQIDKYWKMTEELKGLKEQYRTLMREAKSAIANGRKQIKSAVRKG